MLRKGRQLNATVRYTSKVAFLSKTLFITGSANAGFNQIKICPRKNQL